MKELTCQPRSQGLSSLPPLVVGTETLVAACHVTIYSSKTAGWVGTQVHLVERTIKYPTLAAYFSATQILGGHVTKRDQGLCSNDQGRQRRETLGTRLLTCSISGFTRPLKQGGGIKGRKYPGYEVKTGNVTLGKKKKEKS